LETPAQINRALQARMLESFIQAKPVEKYSYDQRTKFILSVQGFLRLKRAVKMIDY